MTIPAGNARLDFLIRAEAEVLAREEYELSLKLHDPGGISTCAEAWAELDTGPADDGDGDDEPEDYSRSLMIDTHEYLLRDLSRRASVDAALHRLGAEVGVDTSRGVWWTRTYDGWYLQTPSNNTLPRRVWFGWHPLGVGKLDVDAYAISGDLDLDWCAPLGPLPKEWVENPIAALAVVLMRMFALSEPKVRPCL